MSTIDIASGIIAGMDAPDPEALAHTAAPSSPSPSPSDPSALPPGFSPDVHESDPAGRPILNKDKTLRRRRGLKRGQPQPWQQKQTAGAAGETAPAASPAASADAPLEDPPQASEDEIDRAARAMVENIVTLGSLLGGEEWRPRTEETHPAGIDEEEQLVDAWRRHYRVNGVPEDNPMFGAYFVTGKFAFARVSMPITQGRLKQFWGMGMGWINGGLAKLGLK